MVEQHTAMPTTEAGAPAMETCRRALERLMIEHGVVGFFEEAITLRSGRQSHWYVNWRKAASDAFILEQVAEIVWQAIQALALQPDCVCGVPEGATKLGLLVQLQLAKASPNYGPGSCQLPMLRGKPKTHGAVADRDFVGKPQGRMILIEDVTTTGMSLIETVDRLQESEIEIVAAMSLTDRQSPQDPARPVDVMLRERGIPFFPIVRADTLLDVAIEALQPAPAIAESVRRELTSFRASSS